MENYSTLESISQNSLCQNYLGNPLSKVSFRKSTFGARLMEKIMQTFCRIYNYNRGRNFFCKSQPQVGMHGPLKGTERRKGWRKEDYPAAGTHVKRKTGRQLYTF